MAVKEASMAEQRVMQSVRVTPAEQDAWTAAAADAGLSRHDWIRTILNMSSGYQDADRDKARAAAVQALKKACV